MLGCVVQFGSGDLTNEEPYESMFGKAVGSARLSRLPALLAPDERAERSDAVTKTTRVCVSRVCCEAFILYIYFPVTRSIFVGCALFQALICSHANTVCPTSPCMRDAVRRQIMGPRLWATRQVPWLRSPPGPAHWPAHPSVDPRPVREAFDVDLGSTLGLG